MSTHLRVAVVVAASVLVSPHTAYGQQIETSFTQLTNRLRPGEPLVVTDTSGATRRHRFAG